TIAAGKRADLVVVDGDPLARISDIRKVRFVMTRGTLYDAASLWKQVGFEPLPRRLQPESRRVAPDRTLRIGFAPRGEPMVSSAVAGGRAPARGALVLGLTLAASSSSAAEPPVLFADRVLLNGKILTVDAADTVAEALAIKGGKI